MKGQIDPEPFICTHTNPQTGSNASIKCPKWVDDDDDVRILNEADPLPEIHFL